MDDFISNYKNELRNKALEILDGAFNKCPYELFFINKEDFIIHTTETNRFR